MKGSEAIIKSLEQQGVKHIFGHPGGAILDVYDALYESNIEHILVRHEQCAAHAADGYARASGKIGVCMATSGPGATNLLTGIATANAEPSSVVGYASAESTPSPLTSQTAAIDPSKSIVFLPVEGAPQSTVSALNRSLRNSSQVHGLGLVPGNTTNAKYRVKGYFSALNDGTGTLLVYIWDVVDQNGNRIHRINGRERTGNASADPWQSITDQEISAVADTTAAKLKSWVEARS